ncbi:MAG: cupin domain-containing protein [Phycisphaerales bacterium]|jgi:mannose-6-phosphate isomerase-like protein (cupin superfamily)
MADTQAPTSPLFLAPNEGERINVVGDDVRVLADSSTTGGRCFIFELRTPAGSGPPLHTHGIDDEFFFVIEGHYRFLRDGTAIDAGPGAFFVAPKGSQHTFVNVGATTGRLLIITTPGGLEVPFRKTHEASKAGQPTPESLAAIFAPFQLTIDGPPLGRV